LTKRTMIVAVVLVLLSAAITSALMVRSTEQSSDTSNDIADATSSGSMSLGATATKKITVYYFYSTKCPHCTAIAPYIDAIDKKYSQMTVLKYQVNGNSKNWALYQEFMKKYHASPQQVPAVFLGSKALIGQTAIKANLEPTIRLMLK